MNSSSIKIIVIPTIMLVHATFFAGCATSTKPELTHAQRARMMVQVANAALLEHDPTGALQNLIAAEAEDPSLPEIYHSEALAYYEKNDIHTALIRAQKAVKMSARYPDAENTLGKILVDLGRYDEAVGPLSRASHEPLYRETFKPLTNLGILYYPKGDLAKASEYFEQAIASGEDQACVAYYYRGHLKLRDGNFSDAIRDYTQATKKMCGGFADAHLAIAITYERTKQYDLARRTFLQIEQRFPNTKAAGQAVSRLRSLP